VSSLAQAGGVFACLLFYFFPFVSIDVCSDVRQLFKGHPGMKSNFYAVTMIDSSDFINLVNINHGTQNIFRSLLDYFCNKVIVTKTLLEN
jgi:hypothetical protein